MMRHFAARAATSGAAFAGIAIAAALTAPASANLATGAGVAVVVPTDNTLVTVIFKSSSAAYKGKLYFMGSGDEDTVLNPAANSNATGLGKFLFDSRTSTLNQSKTLVGTFSQGDVLHFAYDILRPNAVAFDLFRTDVADDQGYFTWKAGTRRLGVEDHRPPLSDWDFNDMLVKVKFSSAPLPGPAGMALLGIAALNPRGRRRRSA